MVIFALASTQRVTPHSLRSSLSWSSGASLRRFGHLQFVWPRQEVKEFYLQSSEGIHCHHQREWHFLKRAFMSNLKSKDVMLATSKEEHNFTLEAIVHETARQSPLLASNVEGTEKASVSNVGMESNVDILRNAPLVYRRRSQRNMIAEEVLDAKDLDIKPEYLVPLREPMEEAATRDPRKTSQNINETKTSSQHIDSEMATHSQITLVSSQQIEPENVKTGKKRVTAKTSHNRDTQIIPGSQKSRGTAKASQQIELENVKTGKKRVTAKTSHNRDTQIIPGSQKSRGTAKASQQTEGETATSQCMEMAGSSAKKKKTERISQSLDATSSENYEMDNLIKEIDPWLSLVHKKVQTEWSAYNPLTMRRPSPPSNTMKLLSWNVNGLRALLKGKGGQAPGAAIFKLAEKEDFDVMSLQETKLQEKDVLTIKEALLPGYDNSLWSCSTAKLGYSGTAVISRIKPLSVSYGLGIPNHDSEGRVITVEFERFFLVTCYVPNSGQKLERLAYRTEDWDSSLGNYIKDLEKKKPVILTGDLNCAHQEIDIYNPDGNRRSAGFTDEERSSFEKNFLHKGLFDTFRRQHPNIVGYTYWGYRTAARPKNQGWRLDYFLASDALLDLVHDSYILPDVEGSDHCPIGLTLKC